MRIKQLSFLAILAALILSACTPSTPLNTATQSPEGTQGDEPTGTPTTQPLGVNPQSLRGITIYVWHAFDGPEYNFFVEQVNLFSATNEWGIIVNMEDYPDYTSLFEAVTAARDAGSGLPDLVAALPEQALTWNDAGMVAALTLYLHDPTFGMTTEDIADIPSIFLTQDTVNGELLGLPAQRSARFLFYNETWAQELGFTSPPQTADEFRGQACAANASFRSDSDLQNDGYGGWVLDTRWETDYAWLLAFGGGVTSGGTYSFNTDKNLTALQFLKSLYDDNCAWLSTEPNPLDAFAHRSALFISADLASARLAAESMQRNGNADAWSLIPYPGEQTQNLVVYGPSYNVLKSTPERQLAAWLLARWMLRPENQAQWVEADGTLPLRMSLLGMIPPFRASLPQWESALGALPYGQTVPQLASWRTMRYVLEDGLTAIFQDNTPVDQLGSVLAEMDATAAELTAP